MDTLNRLTVHAHGPLFHGFLAGVAVASMASLGLHAGISAWAAVALPALLAGVVAYRLVEAAALARSGEARLQERRAAERHAEIQASHAVAASEARSDFLGAISREFRAPLNGVMGFATMLLDTPLNPEQREFAQMVQRSGDELLGIINDVLDHSKIEAGRMSVESIDVDLRSICEEVRISLQSALGARELGIVLSYDPSLPRFIQGDPVRIRQVLLNLAGNAVKFTERGAVRIEVSPADSALKVSVIDTGIGMSVEQLQGLFAPLPPVDAQQTLRYGGSGRSLGISKTLIELMGGAVGAHSVRGQGSSFWFTLPLGSSAVPQDSMPQSVRQDSVPQSVQQDLVPQSVQQDLVPQSVQQDLVPQNSMQQDPVQDLVPPHSMQAASVQHDSAPQNSMQPDSLQHDSAAQDSTPQDSVATASELPVERTIPRLLVPQSAELRALPCASIPVLTSVVNPRKLRPAPGRIRLSKTLA